MQKKTYWQGSDIQRLFRKELSKQTLAQAEKLGLIPKAERVQRGKQEIRVWRAKDLHHVGRRYGFLKQPQKFHSIAVYSAKGGILKTTLSFNLARALALHGIKTLVVGLDTQGSITDLFLKPLDSENESFEELPSHKCISHLLDSYRAKHKIKLSDYILNTDLPHLDLLPETPDLALVPKRMVDMTKREWFLADKILPLIKEQGYQVVIWDNGPNFTLMTENCLAAASTIITPMGCDPLSFQAMATNLASILDFQSELGLKWDNFFLVPTLLEKTKLSLRILMEYSASFGNKKEWPEFSIPNFPIRRSLSGAESCTVGQSIFEAFPTSQLAEDYFDLIRDIWSQILASEGEHGKNV